MLLQELQCLIKLESDEHEVLVDAIVVNLVPMQVEDVYEGLKPLLLLIDAMLFTNLCEELGNPQCQLALVRQLVTVPVGYKGMSVFLWTYRRRDPPRACEGTWCGSDSARPP